MIKWIKKLLTKEDEKIIIANKLAAPVKRDWNKPSHVHRQVEKAIKNLGTDILVASDGRTYAFENKLWSKHLTGANTGDETVPTHPLLEYRGIYELMSGEYPSERGIEAGFTWTIKITNEHFRLQGNRVYDGYYLIAKVNNPGQIKENWVTQPGVYQ